MLLISMIIGITGTQGSGKGTVVKYLEKKGFIHHSASDYITKEIIRQGLPVSRDTMREVADRLRKKNGPDYVIRMLYEAASKTDRDAVIESIRNPQEAEFLKKKGAVIL